MKARNQVIALLTGMIARHTLACAARLAAYGDPNGEAASFRHERDSLSSALAQTAMTGDLNRWRTITPIHVVR